MADRSWFYASQGQQQGPCSEAQLRDLFARRTVTADTLVWSEGMSGWQKAGDIPGLLSAVSGPPAIPSAGGGAMMGTGGGPGGAISIEIEIWNFIWRSLVLFIGCLLVIPVPWVVVMYLRWMVSCLRVPGRPDLTFTGRATTLMWYYLLIVVLIILAAIPYALDSAPAGFHGLSTLIELVFSWLLIRWVVANISSQGQPLRLSFSGSFWAFLGYTLLAGLAFITIIGWAWVYAAQLRWMARNIQGTRRAIVYNGTGLQILWRTVVTAIASVFIIPIPWVGRWYMSWQASQFALVPRA